MNKNSYKLISIFFLSAILAVYTNCGQPFGGPSPLIFEGNIYGGGSQASYAAFRDTVYPLTRAYCVNCHASTQPLHASNDLTTAHDAVISQFKVNFSNIPASRLVAKLRDENHNCWGDCAANAASMQTQIEIWNAAIRTTAPPSRDPASSNAKLTAETLTLQEEFMDSSNPHNTDSVKLNIETALLTPPMVRSNSPEGVYLSVPNASTETLASGDSSAGTSYMSFQVPTNGRYVIYGLTKASEETNNSFHVNVRNQANQSLLGNYRTFEFPVSASYEWRRVSNITMTLNAGQTYTLELRERETRARASSFLVTTLTDFNGIWLNEYLGKTLTFDLSELVGVPGVEFKIDVVDYDAFTYKMSKPRIISSNVNIRAKGIKILMNDIYSPQHSTFSMVNRIATPDKPVLSDYSMIMIKDKGISGDKLKISFDELEVTTATNVDEVEVTITPISLTAFRETVYPISRSEANTCIECHTTRNPAHASDNSEVAHNAVLNVVDFNNIPNSRIVRRMRIDRHQCNDKCDELATSYEAAISSWKTRREAPR